MFWHPSWFSWVNKEKNILFIFFIPMALIPVWVLNKWFHSAGFKSTHYKCTSIATWISSLLLNTDLGSHYCLFLFLEASPAQLCAVAVWIHLMALWLCVRGRLGTYFPETLLSLLSYFRQKLSHPLVSRFQVVRVWPCWLWKWRNVVNIGQVFLIHCLHFQSKILRIK